MWVNVDIESSYIFQEGLLLNSGYEFVNSAIIIISSL